MFLVSTQAKASALREQEYHIVWRLLHNLCGHRCVYDGKADYLAVAQQQQSKGKKKTGAGGTSLPDPERAQTRRTRSQRDPGAENGFVNLVKPIWCLDPKGNPVQMQQQDVALMTYEQLRKELGASDK